MLATLPWLRCAGLGCAHTDAAVVVWCWQVPIPPGATLEFDIEVFEWHGKADKVDL